VTSALVGSTLGVGFWLAVSGTLCCFLASSLAVCAHRSTRSARLDKLDDAKAVSLLKVFLSIFLA
jgi:hypothetical protein